MTGPSARLFWGECKKRILQPLHMTVIDLLLRIRLSILITFASRLKKLCGGAKDPGDPVSVRPQKAPSDPDHQSQHEGILHKVVPLLSHISYQSSFSYNKFQSFIFPSFQESYKEIIRGGDSPTPTQEKEGSKKQTFHILHHDKKRNHQDRHKETIEELPSERLPILLCRDLEAAMRAILQPHDIRHRPTAMRTHLAVPRRILRALLRRQLRQDLHRRIQQPAPTRRAETEHIPLIHPPAPSAAHRILRQRLLQHLMTRRTSIPALPHPMPAIRTLGKMRPRRLPAPRLRRMRRL